jgi:hypothetical protein
VKGLCELVEFIPFHLLEQVNLMTLVIDVNGCPCRPKLLNQAHVSTVLSGPGYKELYMMVDMFGIAITEPMSIVLAR